MAPVKTIGLPRERVVSRKKAVSSSVSVPCVMTTPSKSSAIKAVLIRFFKTNISDKVTCGLGKLKISSVTKFTSSNCMLTAFIGLTAFGET